MSESKYWFRLFLTCFLGGAAIFYLVLNLTIKSGKVRMPDLKGLNKAVAQRKLESMGLKMAVKQERFDSHSPYGVVLEQDIESGVTLKSGRTVEVIVSRGTQAVGVPELKGMASLRQARLLLEQNGLLAGIVDEMADAAPKETVLSQSPEAGIEVARGTAVSLLLSSGTESKTWVMPDLKHLDAAKARALARTMGLILRRVTEKKLAGIEPGRVGAQSLSAGAKVKEADELILTVAEGELETEAARLTLIEYQVPTEGYAEKRVRVVLVDALGERALYNAMARPGEKIKLEPRVRGKASYRISLAGLDVEEKEIP